MNKNIFVCLLFFAMVYQSQGQHKIETDVINTSKGKLTIHFIGHGTLMFEMSGKTIYIDPVSQYADYKTMPKADLILITHHHPDHLDAIAIAILSKKETQIVLTAPAFESLKKGTVMKNGETKMIAGFSIEAVPAYNTTEGFSIYHPAGRDNGYVITFGDKRVYVAGDTENTPEMAKLKNIDIAFLPMNQPYTMTPEQVADAASRFNPKILYPYHTGETDISKLTDLMKSNKAVEVRIRSMK